MIELFTSNEGYVCSTEAEGKYVSAYKDSRLTIMIARSMNPLERLTFKNEMILLAVEYKINLFFYERD